MRSGGNESNLSDLLGIYKPNSEPVIGKHTKNFAASLSATSAADVKASSTEPTIKQMRATVAESLEGKTLHYPTGITPESYSESTIGELSCYMLRHENAAEVPTVVMFYGGGFCLNTMKAHQAFMANVTDRVPCNIILPDCPLAPETKAPQIIAQVNAFIKALFSSPLTYGVSEDIILMGWSSGANLALTVALNLRRDEPSLFSNISQLILLSPWTDLSMRVLTKGPFQTQQNTDTIAAGVRPLTQMSKWYLPESATGVEPEFCPASREVAELTLLPRTTIIAGGSEVLLGDAVFVTDALQRAGAPVQLVVLQGQTHNYLVFDQLSKDGVFVPDVIESLVNDKLADDMVGKEDGLGLTVKSFNEKSSSS